MKYNIKIHEIKTRNRIKNKTSIATKTHQFWASAPARPQSFHLGPPGLPVGRAPLVTRHMFHYHLAVATHLDHLSAWGAMARVARKEAAVDTTRGSRFCAGFLTLFAVCPSLD